MKYMDVDYQIYDLTDRSHVTNLLAKNHAESQILAIFRDWE